MNEIQSLAHLEPQVLWRHFEDLCRIPRSSKNEQQASAYVVSLAKEKKLDVRRDDAGNVVIVVPATPGHEESPKMVLQSHLDMVCVKRSDVEHDFDRDPIPVAVEGDWVTARGTTLGADDGIGVAAALAVLDDPTVVHGPLELLFTVDEETGLTGAKALDPSMIAGRRMLNIDTDTEDTFFIGCAGGADTKAVVPVERIDVSSTWAPAQIRVHGLRGGHSGADIHENRANAIKLLIRVLLAAVKADVDLKLVSLEGGSKHNAIPREASATLRISRKEFDKLREVVDEAEKAFVEEFGPVDPDLHVQLVEMEDLPETSRVMTTADRDRVLAILDGIPHGVMAMSRDIHGLVESSNNLALVRTEDRRVIIDASARSSVASALRAVQSQVRSICLLGGAEVSEHDGYPGWKPNPDSPLLRVMVSVFQRMFGQAPKVTAIHAGLECGIIGEKFPGMDTVSLGPQIEGAHSPGERVHIGSVEKLWKYVKAVLRELA